MRVIDLTHTISADMPVYPGTLPPTLRPATTIEKEGFRETELCIYSHVGTHMDAPAHLLPGRPALDSLPADRFIGAGLVVDCRHLPPGGQIGAEHLAPYGAAFDAAEYVLFHTGWSGYWKQEHYFAGYPWLSVEAARRIVASGKKGVGVDAISVDRVEDTGLAAHHILLQSGLLIVENLTNLCDIGEDPFTFYALPLKFEDADGAPVRAIAVAG